MGKQRAESQRDSRNLLAAWKLYGGPDTPAGRFIVHKPLTPAQLRRLPEALKDLLQSDDVIFLERLYGLEDPRG